MAAAAPIARAALAAFAVALPAQARDGTAARYGHRGDGGAVGHRGRVSEAGRAPGAICGRACMKTFTWAE
ncbi:hypothetical protein FE772_13855 [Lysobacter enzymogenes]|nr:hypothetical protein [Lysobacter enzymogenes]QCW26584.1 hypothetical protein FE772_13855 [Lysobacter enzymogenes]